MAEAHPTFFPTDPQPLKRCSACRQKLPLTRFTRNRSQPDGFSNQCKSCHLVHSRRSRARHLDRYRAKVRACSWRRKGIDLSESQYQAMLQAQGGLCAICRCAPAGKTRAGLPEMLSVDHDHSTRAIRQLLCGNCNRGIGLFKESPAILQAAIAYLRRHGKNE